MNNHLVTKAKPSVVTEIMSFFALNLYCTFIFIIVIGYNDVHLYIDLFSGLTQEI